MLPLCDDTERALRAAEISRALAHPVRLRLAAALCGDAPGTTGPAALAARLGLPLEQVTRHLAPLLAARLIATAPGRDGPRYRVAEPALHGLVACMEDCAP